MAHHDYYLTCDAGGTNTTIALVARSDTTFTIVERFQYRTGELPSLLHGLREVMARVPAAAGLCISAAGPVEDGVCRMTNVPWIIREDEVQEALGLPVIVINDFSAVCYGIPLLHEDAHQIAPLVSAGEKPPHPRGTVRAAVGAGTGLGTGYLITHADGYHAYPAEAGHSGSFAPYDELSLEMYRYVWETTGHVPGAELFVSGQGLENTLRFWQDSRGISRDSPLHRITADRHAGRHISEAAHQGDPSAREMMRLFVRNYATAAATTALHFLPRAGLYLAGGIVTKNRTFFEEDNCFLEAFTRNYVSEITDLLRSIPIYMVLDYEVSLYGGGYAAWYTACRGESSHG